MCCAIAFPKISCLYLPKFALARSMYSLGISGISLNALKLLMTKCLFSLCEQVFSCCCCLGASLVLHQHPAAEKIIFTCADTDHNQSPP